MKNRSRNSKPKVTIRTPNKAKDKRFFLDKRTHHQRTKLLCRYCRAIYENNSWQAFEKLNPQYVDELKMSVCPACHEEIEHISDGVLHLNGSGVAIHKEEIKNLINNIGKTAEQEDILDRVERIDDSVKEQIIVYTTKNQLAVKIGKQVASSHKGGKLDIKWSKNDKPVEVYWRYDK